MKKWLLSFQSLENFVLYQSKLLIEDDTSDSFRVGLPFVIVNKNSRLKRRRFDDQRNDVVSKVVFPFNLRRSVGIY